jgi:hypothetical protein
MEGDDGTWAVVMHACIIMAHGSIRHNSSQVEFRLTGGVPHHVWMRMMGLGLWSCVYQRLNSSQVEFRNIDVATDALVGSAADPTVGQVSAAGCNSAADLT